MRYEVTVNTVNDLNDAIALINQHGIKEINITHKKTELMNYIAAERLLQKIPDLDITVHVSMKYIPDSTQLDKYIYSIKKIDIKKILLVSGSPKPSFDTLAALENIKKYKLNTHVVYNPYFTEDKLKVENERLKRKLKYNISGIYLQIGQDLQKLIKGIEYARSLSPDLQTFGSLLIPNQEIVNRFKEKPIQDIFLSEKYLNDLKYAKEITEQISEAYQQYNITPLIENIPFSQLTHYLKNYNNQFYKL